MRLSATVATAAAIAAALSACKTPTSQSSLRDDEVPGANPPQQPPAASTDYKGPPGGLDDDANYALWSQYCVGEKMNPAVIPQPKYDSDDVMRAGKILSEMNPHSFALYGQIKDHYVKGMQQQPAGITPTAHEFLVYLCGEFRDRAGLVKAKIEWIHNTNYLAVQPQGEIDPSKNPWLQMTAETYKPYLAFSRAYYNAKMQALQAKGKLTFGAIAGVDRPVAPQGVCETKYMFAEYLDAKKPFPGLQQFQQGLAAWQDANCTQEDKDHYYDFRGDGNFKPNSPESNGMIWHGISTALQCKDTVTKRDTPKYPGQALILSNEQCREYFARPFLSRWAGARAGLGTWMLHDRAHDAHFKNSKKNVMVVPNWANGAKNGPHRYKMNGVEGQLVQGWEAHWLKNTLGLYEIAGTGAAEAPGTQQFIYEKMRNAVDRHTDWYASAYDDDMKQKRERDQAYSPFVASSYEMSESDAFTAPCYTIPCNGDVPARHWKHYMFVFKVHKDNYYSTEDLAANKQIDFDKHWFDETTFGTTQLAKAEKAWDRLGTALETELDSILYLHHICSNGTLETAQNTCD